MTCPVCGGKTTVYDSIADCESVYRKRKCVECDHKFITTESESNDEDTFEQLKYERRVNKYVARQ